MNNLRGKNSEENIFCGIGKELSDIHFLICAYVFGSVVNGEKNPGDLDIGILIDRELAGGDVLPASVQIYDLLRKTLNRNDIDVVPLNDASHALRHEVIAKGRCVYEKSEKERVDFEAKSELAYFDFLPFQRKFDRATMQHILGEL